MDNQHRKISGYRELNEREIEEINRAKYLGSSIGAMIDKLKGDQNIDQRWLSIAQTDLQKGLMALVRSIAKPDFF
jgi:hypothetical protein